MILGTVGRWPSHDGCAILCLPRSHETEHPINWPIRRPFSCTGIAQECSWEGKQERSVFKLKQVFKRERRTPRRMLKARVRGRKTCVFVADTSQISTLHILPNPLPLGPSLQVPLLLLFCLSPSQMEPPVNREHVILLLINSDHLLFNSVFTFYTCL